MALKESISLQRLSSAGSNSDRHVRATESDDDLVDSSHIERTISGS
jgi:hypothetical protein